MRLSERRRAEIKALYENGTRLSDIAREYRITPGRAWLVAKNKDREGAKP